MPLTDETAPALIETLERRFLTVNDDVRVGRHTINVFRPRSAEDLISEQDYVKDERLPYWAELWPSSTILAKAILAAKLEPARGIELGCGVGLVSIAASMAGHTMLATDYYDDALLFARANMFRNLQRDLDTRMVDWRAMPKDLGTFELVLASDVLYESSYATIVSDAIATTLAPAGRALVADPGRVAAGAFVNACEERRLRVTIHGEFPYLAGKIRQTITVYEIKR